MARETPPRSLAVELATALRDQIAPWLGGHTGRAHAGEAQGGDVTFAIDERAEAFMERFLAERAPDVAFYSEDRGLVSPGDGAEWVLVVDPIDGTRPAMAGLEAACVSVALAPRHAPSGDGPTMGDVQTGCVIEIKSGQRYVANRGEGLEPTASLSANTDPAKMFWAYGLRGRPMRAIAEVVGDLIDASSVGGGTFDLGSASFDLTRIATGQLDAYVVAAAVLILEEAGAMVTDAYGKPLGPRPLLGSGADFQLSCVAAATPELHDTIVHELNVGVQRLLQKVG